MAVHIHNLTFDEGMPKICVPLVSGNLQDLQKDIAALSGYPFDLIEWRVDFFQEGFQKGLNLIRTLLPETIVLCTFRTAREGGARMLDVQAYNDFVRSAIATEQIDMVDLELFTSGDAFADICREAHTHGIVVVGSNHDFQKTPDSDDMYARLEKMREGGADISKIAVMPKSAGDVLDLLSVTLKAKQAGMTVITMAMGETGVVSRVCGETFGSCVTFGTVGQASAPGQIPADRLKEILTDLHAKKGM